MKFIKLGYKRGFKDAEGILVIDTTLYDAFNSGYKLGRVQANMER